MAKQTDVQAEQKQIKDLRPDSDRLAAARELTSVGIEHTFAEYELHARLRPARGEAPAR